MVQSTTQVRTSYYLPSIASLPDGNYRYIMTNTPMTEAELAQTESLIFLFRKTGNEITGQLSLANISKKICISGQVNVNTITGRAVELFERLDKAVVRSGSEEFATWDVAGSLRVRRGTKAGDKVIYKSAIFDLNGYNRTNTGTELPPISCPA